MTILMVRAGGVGSVEGKTVSDERSFIRGDSGVSDSMAGTESAFNSEGAHSRECDVSFGVNAADNVLEF